MNEHEETLENASNYLKHCTGCPHRQKGESGKPVCTKLDGGGYGQLPALVKEGMPCPVGKFGADEQKPKPEPKPEPEAVEERPHFIFTILESCKSATFHFDDGDLTWTKK